MVFPKHQPINCKFAKQQQCEQQIVALSLHRQTAHKFNDEFQEDINRFASFL